MAPITLKRGTSVLLFLLAAISPCMASFMDNEDISRFPTSKNDVEPDFARPSTNVSVSLGRDATLACMISNLNGYKVGWIKTDTKAIQAIHDHVITHNSRVWVSHADDVTWNLHINKVQEDDKGEYMCQLNTDPMKSQSVFLDLAVSPDIVNEETSGDLQISEGGSVKLLCKARGYPKPRILWRKEEIMDNTVSGGGGGGGSIASSIVTNRTSEWKGDKDREKGTIFHEGEVLQFVKITRQDMGSYLCIASNGIPPSVSKRITINVHFHPMIYVTNQLVGAPRNTDITLECKVQAYPKPIIYWVKNNGEMMVTNSKYEVSTTVNSIFETVVRLKIRKFVWSDAASYKCNAKNSVGDMELGIRVYEIPSSPGATETSDHFLKRTFENANVLKGSIDEDPELVDAEGDGKGGDPRFKLPQHHVPAPSASNEASFSESPTFLLLSLLTFAGLDSISLLNRKT